MFIERPPLTTSPTERLTTEVYQKLWPRRLGSYRIISADPEYVNFWQDGIENTFSVNRLNKAPRANEKNNDDTVSKGSGASNDIQPPERKKGREKKMRRGKDSQRHKDLKRNGFTACEGMATTQPTIRMNLRHKFRRTSSIATGINKSESRRAAYWPS